MSETITQKAQLAAIATNMGDDAVVLRSANVQEVLGKPFNIEVEFTQASPDKPVKPKELIGTNSTLRLTLPSGEQRFWNGQIIDLDYAGQTDDLPLFRATIAPRLHFLGRTADFRAIQGKTVPDIIKEIFKDHALDEVKMDLHGTYEPWDYCLQYRETDLNFISRLMEQEGIYYYFTHENGKHTLVVTDDAANHVSAPNYELLTWRPGGGGGDEDGEYVSDLLVNHTVQPDSYTTGDYDFRTPRKLLRSTATADTNHAAGSFDVFDFPGEWDNPSDGEHFTKLRLQELQAQKEIISGTTNSRGVAAGSLVTVREHPVSELNRNYLVTSVHLSFANDNLRTGGDGDGGTFHCNFTAIDAKTQYRTPRSAPKPVIQGPQTAVVVGPAGSEIHTDKFGRVKIQFHWDRYGQRDEKSSFWCRVSQAWAGKNWGAIFVPRIGMEVVVSFLEGDPDQPLITGYLYNGENMPPYALPDHATRSTIKSNSSKGGGGFNELRFEDKKGSEQVFVHAEKLLDLRVKDTRREYVGNERHLIVEKDQYEHAKLNKHSIVKADSFDTVEGSTNSLVKGDALSKISGTEHHTSETERRVKVGGDDSLEVSTALNLKAGTTTSLDTGTALHVKCGTAAALEAGMTVYVKAGMSLVLEAGMQLSLKVGGNFIDINPAGVFIQGTMVMINSGGAAGSGQAPSPVAPVAPDDPDPTLEAKVADDDKPGEVTKTKPTPPPKTTPGPKASVLINASKGGTPFCAKCEAQAKLQQAVEGAKDEEEESEDEEESGYVDPSEDEDVVEEGEDEKDEEEEDEEEEEADDEKRPPVEKLCDDLVDAVTDTISGKGVDEKAALKLASNAMKAVGDRLVDFVPEDQKELREFLGNNLDTIAKNVRSGNVGNLHREVAADAIGEVGKVLDKELGGTAGGVASAVAGKASDAVRGEDKDQDEADDEDEKDDKKDEAGAAKKLVSEAMSKALDALGKLK